MPAPVKGLPPQIARPAPRQASALAARPLPSIRLQGWILFAVLLFAFGYFKCLQNYSFHTNTYDVAVYSNVAWNLAHGKGFYSPINRVNQLGEHFSPIMALFAPFYLVWDSAYTILLAQALAVALTILLIHILARELAAHLPERERGWVAWTITGMALFYLPLDISLIFEFHPSTLGMPMVAGAFLCLHRRRMKAFWLLVALLLTTKEVALLSIAGLGLYAGIKLGRRRLMFTLLGLAGVAALLIFLWVMPALRSGKPWGHYGRLGALSHSGEKELYVLLLAAYLGLLPLLGGRVLAIVVPTTVLNLLVKTSTHFSMNAHYDDQNCVFWLVAATYGLLRLNAWVDRPPLRLRRWRRGRRMLSLLLIGAALWGSADVIRDAVQTARLDRKIRWLEQKLKIYKELPPETGIVTQDALAPHLCYRDEFVRLDDAVMKKPEKYLKPGDYIVLSPPLGHYQLDMKKALSYLKAHPGRYQKIENDKRLIVFLAR